MKSAANDTRLAVNKCTRLRDASARVNARTERRPTTERENGRQDERETVAELNLRQEMVHAGRRGARLTDVGGVRGRVADPSAVFPRKPLRPRSLLSSETVVAADSCAAAAAAAVLKYFFRHQFLTDVIF